MKKAVFILLANLMVISAFAQNSNVNKANTYLDQEGKLAEAKQLIDEAIVHEKTMEKGSADQSAGTFRQKLKRARPNQVLRAIGRRPVS